MSLLLLFSGSGVTPSGGAYWANELWAPVYWAPVYWSHPAVAPVVFNPYWAQNSNRTVGMFIHPE